MLKWNVWQCIWSSLRMCKIISFYKSLSFSMLAESCYSTHLKSNREEHFKQIWLGKQYCMSTRLWFKYVFEKENKSGKGVRDCGDSKSILCCKEAMKAIFKGLMMEKATEQQWWFSIFLWPNSKSLWNPFLDTIVLVVMHAKDLYIRLFQLGELTCREANLERRMNTTCSTHQAEQLEQMILIVY